MFSKRNTRTVPRSQRAQHGVRSVAAERLRHVEALRVLFVEVVARFHRLLAVRRQREATRCRLDEARKMIVDDVDLQCCLDAKLSNVGAECNDCFFERVSVSAWLRQSDDVVEVRQRRAILQHTHVDVDKAFGHRRI